MALIIDKEHPSGIILSYWNIVSIDLSLLDSRNGANIKLRGYISKDIRDSGYSEVFIENVHVSNIKDFLLATLHEGDNTFTAIYGIIKLQDGWTEAVDDI